MTIRSTIHPSTLSLDIFDLTRAETENQFPFTDLRPAADVHTLSSPETHDISIIHHHETILNRIYATLTRRLRHPIHPRHGTRQIILTPFPVSSSSSSSSSDSVLDPDSAATIILNSYSSSSNEEGVTTPPIFERALPLISSSSSVHQTSLRNPMILELTPVSIRRDTELERNRFHRRLFQTLRRAQMRIRRERRGPSQARGRPTARASFEVHRREGRYPLNYPGTLSVLAEDGSNIDVHSESMPLRRTRSMTLTQRYRAFRFPSIRRVVGARSLRTINDHLSGDYELYADRFPTQPTIDETIEEESEEEQPNKSTTSTEDTLQSRRISWGRARDIYRMLGSFEDHYRSPSGATQSGSVRKASGEANDPKSAHLVTRFKEVAL